MTEYWTGGDGVTPATLRAKVREIAKREPETFYQQPEGSDRCLYTHGMYGEEETPGCIIGKAIFELTGKLVDQDKLRWSVRHMSWKKALGVPFPISLSSLYDETMKDFQWIGTLQSLQDQDMSWGDAMAQADLIESSD